MHYPYVCSRLYTFFLISATQFSSTCVNFLIWIFESKYFTYLHPLLFAELLRRLHLSCLCSFSPHIFCHITIYRVSQFKLPSHVGVIELVETNKKAHAYIWHNVKIEGHWLLKYANLQKFVNFKKCICQFDVTKWLWIDNTD